MLVDRWWALRFSDHCRKGSFSTESAESGTRDTGAFTCLIKGEPFWWQLRAGSWLAPMIEDAGLLSSRGDSVIGRIASA